MQDYFVTGGTLPPGADCYVTRPADTELLEALMRGELCYVLSSRQMGKSSLMVRTARKVRERGASAILFDLTGIGSNVTPEQWYLGMLCQFGDATNRLDEILNHWDGMRQLSPLQRFVSCMRSIAAETASGPIVVFIDEIDYVTLLPFSTDEFFAAIRECHNRKATDDALGRLTFCLLGVAVPSDLIQDASTTPFNVGRRIILTDFSMDETRILEQGLKASSAVAVRTLMQRVLYWTGGHPYMTQRVCAALVEGQGGTRKDVDRAVRDMFMQEASRDLDPSLAFVERCLIAYSLEQETIISIYHRILLGERIVLDEADPVHNRLILSGAIRQCDGCLRVRNRIFSTVFNREWAARQLPRTEIQMQRFVYLRGIRRGVLMSIYTVFVFVAAGIAVLSSHRQAVLSQMRARADEDRAYRLAYDYRFVAILERINHFGLWPGVETLKATQPTGGNEDLRRFEWYYLDKVVHQGRRTVDWLPGAVCAISWNAPGTRFVAGTGDMARIWQGELQDFSQRKLHLGQHIISSNVMSPFGNLAAIATEDGVIRIKRVADGADVTPAGGFPCEKDHLLSVAWSKNGKMLAAAGAGGVIRVFEANVGKVIRRMPAEGRLPARGVWKIAFSNNNRTLAAACDDGMLRIFDALTGQQLSQIKAHRTYIHSVDYGPDGKTVATAGGDGAVQLWDTSSNPPQLLQRMLGHTSYVYDVAISPDGRSVASTGWDKSVRIWDAQTGLQRRFIATQTDGFAVAYRPDSKQIAVGMSSGEVRVYDVGPAQLETPMSGNVGGARRMIISADNRTLVVCGAHGELSSWDTASGNCLQSLLDVREAHASDVSQDGSVAVRCTDTTYLLIAARDGHIIRKGPIGSGGTVKSVSINNDGSLMAVLNANLKIIDTHSGAVVAETTARSVEDSVVLSPDGNRLVLCLHATFRLVDWKHGWQTIVQPEASGEVTLVGFTPDSKTVADCASELRLWNAETGKLKATLRDLAGMYVPSASSADNSRMIYATQYGLLRIWDRTTNQAIMDLPDQKPAANQVAISADGRMIAMHLVNGELRVIDTH